MRLWGRAPGSTDAHVGGALCRRARCLAAPKKKPRRVVGLNFFGESRDVIWGGRLQHDTQAVSISLLECHAVTLGFPRKGLTCL